MIHLGRTSGPLMLDVTAAAVLNVGVERSRLLSEIDGGSGMTCDASGRFHAPDGRVTGLALVAQEGVLTRQESGLKEGAPTRNRCRSRAVEFDDNRQPANEGDGYQYRIENVEFLHESHRSP